jgi:cbb3-type cytochrome oxidase subunit 3
MILLAALIVVVAGALVAAVVMALRGRRRHRRAESGVANFQRHIDALSPEARRAVMDRVRKSSDEPEQN